MKKYFAKYLPVEGEIKEGDKFYDSKFKNLGVQIARWDTKDEYQSKVKLFLCSRDIQVGDIMISMLGPIKGIIEHEIQRDEAIRGNHWYKVVGEISPEATWVKEGAEFDEDELDHYLYCKKHPDESIYGFTLQQIEEWIRYNPNPEKFEIRVDILGPCKHFH